MKRTNKNNTKFQEFDVEKFLEYYNISHKKSGKNVGLNWIGIEECPFCGLSGYHFAINEQSSGFHCWGCGEKGSIIKYIKVLLRCNTGKAFSILKQFWNPELEFHIRETGKEVILPSGLKKVDKYGKQYLANRGFDPEYIIEKYKLKQTGAGSFLNHKGTRSDFQYRLFIPIYMFRELVSYTGRDYTKKREPRYQHPFLEACIVPPSSCIYNIDTVKDRFIALEGPTDVWRMGDETISLQGIETTKEQIRYLTELNIKKAVIMFDSGKEDKARKLGYALKSVVPDVKIASLDSGDPGELSDEEAVKIKQELLYS